MGTKIRSQHEMKVVVIGAGIVGLMTALEIQRAKRQVIIIDRLSPGADRLHPTATLGGLARQPSCPVSLPGLWRRIPTFLIDRSGPFAIRWLHLPHLLPWLLRFVWAGRIGERLRNAQRCASSFAATVR